jgi:hypothetical protein
MPPIKGEKMKINGLQALSFLLLVVGLVFYIAWSTRYNAWLDIGVYSITIVLVLGGLLGLLLNIAKKKT